MAFALGTAILALEPAEKESSNRGNLNARSATEMMRITSWQEETLPVMPVMAGHDWRRKLVLRQLCLYSVDIHDVNIPWIDSKRNYGIGDADQLLELSKSQCK